MTALLFPFLALAAVGFVLSVVAHVASFTGMSLPGGDWTGWLHPGIFVVWLPTVLVSYRIGQGKRHAEFWKVALSGCPTWVRYAGYALVGYCVVNFLFFMVQAGANAAAGSTQIRGFSGHWMLFYGAAFAVLYSVVRNPRLLEKQACGNGHPVSATDVFCPTCGTQVNAKSTH